MAKKKKKQAAKQLIFVGLALVGVQLVLYFFMAEEKQRTVREAIEEAVEKQTGLSSERRELMKIQMAIEDFKTTKAKLPQNLNELVPTYFDRVPFIPGTSEEFKYEVRNGTPFVIGKEAPVSKNGGSSSVSSSEANTEAAKRIIDSISDPAQQVVFTYDPKGQRDPFVPFDLRPKAAEPTGATPLEKYSLGQLKLTAVLGSTGEEPKAIIENQAGKGFTAKRGMKIGLNGGEIIEIHPDRIIVLEKTVDFTGEEKAKKYELRLRSEATEAANP